VKQFSYAERGGPHGSEIKYPDDEFDGEGKITVDGRKLWDRAHAVLGGSIVVGNYKGSLTLDDYAEPVRRRWILTISEFLSEAHGLNGKEQRKIRRYAEDETKDVEGDIYELVARIDLHDKVNLKSPEVAAGMLLLTVTGTPVLLSTARHASIMQGIEL
jgi:hypothetical protein